MAAGAGVIAYPKPEVSPQTHLSRLVEELDWLRLNVGRMPGVTVAEATDVRGAVVDLMEWVKQQGVA